MNCPSQETLEQLLAGALPEPDVATVRRHLPQCDRCQANLNGLSDDPELGEWRPRRSDSQTWYNEPALQELLGSLDRSTMLGVDDSDETLAGGLDRVLSFLDPPKHEGDLGALGTYRILAELGRGGMGVVFKGFDSELNRIVAVKILKKEAGDPRARARFVREAQSAARVKHEHVVTVYSVANPPDTPPFLVMEYVDGVSLRDRIASEERLAPREAAALAVQAADGLAAAHAAGLMHRDVKPSNLMLVGGRPRTGSHDPGELRVKITDFGLARLADLDSSLTHEGIVAGTPTYMSPEQVAEPQRVDYRTDIYSLGVTLYEMLTGDVPFHGTPAAVLRQIESDEPPRPRKLNEAISRDLETICLKAMTKEASGRYQTMAEFAGDLRHWLRGEPIQARPAGSLERAWRWCRRNPRVATLSAAVATLVIVLAIGSTTAAVLIASAHHLTATEKDAAASARVLGVVNAAPDAVPYAVRELMNYAELARPRLDAWRKDESADPSQRLHAACALAALGDTDIRLFTELIGLVPPSPGECKNIVAALLAEKERAAEHLHAEYLAEPRLDVRARLAATMLHLGYADAAADMFALREDPAGRTTLIHEYSQWHGEFDGLHRVLTESRDAAFRSGLCLALGTLDPRTVSSSRRQELQRAWSQLFLESPDGAIHGAVRWAAHQWGYELPQLQSRREPPPDREFFVNQARMTLLQIPPGNFTMGDRDEFKMQHRQPHPVRLTRPFFISDCEVSVDQFRQFLEDVDYPGAKPAEPGSPDPLVSPGGEWPVQNVTWTDAILFCNWLSYREGRKPCYERGGRREAEQPDGERKIQWNDWVWHRDADGYRLPTEAEWEYACRAGTTTRYYFGDDQQLLPRYGLSSNNRVIPALPIGKLIPNGWGLFDMHGNVWEWCWDWYAPFDDRLQIDPVGPEEPSVEIGARRVYRGGGIANFSGDPDSAARGHGHPTDNAHRNLGFRVVRSAH